MQKKIRIGILGAAKIANNSIIKPSRKINFVEIVAVAARDINKAKKFASLHGIPTAYGSYDELINDPNIDLVYVPLPNSYHCEWSIKAMEAGKDVLCEKPIASNSQEILHMQEVAKQTGRKLIEAFHYRYHPLVQKSKEAINKIGNIKKIELCFSIPIIYLGYFPGDIRYKYNMGGGATMDLGVYCIDAMRFLSGLEMSVTKAKAIKIAKDVDLTMKAEFNLSNGAKGKMYCSFYSLNPLKWFNIYANIEGDRGSVNIDWLFLPHIKNKLVVFTDKVKFSEKIKGETTYYYQLKTIVEHLLNGSALPLTINDSIQNMLIIDDIYKKAGLDIRGIKR